MDHLGYARLAEFLEAWAQPDSERIKTLAGRIRSNLREPGPKQEIDVSKVSKVLGSVVRLGSTWDARSDLELRKDLQVQRLHREQMNKIPSMTLPDESSPNKNHRALVSPPAGCDGPRRTVTVSTFIEARGDCVKLDLTEHT